MPQRKKLQSNFNVAETLILQSKILRLAKEKLVTCLSADRLSNPKGLLLPLRQGCEGHGAAGEKEGSFLIQKINLDNVKGLWYQAYPVARGEGTPKTLRMGDDIGYACEGVSEKLVSIDFSGQMITFTKIVGQRPYGGCPI